MLPLRGFSFDAPVHDPRTGGIEAVAELGTLNPVAAASLLLPVVRKARALRVPDLLARQFVAGDKFCSALPSVSRLIITERGGLRSCHDAGR